MSMLSRWLLAGLAISLSSCASNGGSSKQSTTPAPSGDAWSDPATWPSNHVPVAGDEVVIPQGKQILLDVSPPELAGLTIDGTLVFDDRDLELSADWIVVHGELRIGAEDRLHQNAATLTLTSPDTDGSVMDMGTRGILVMGGHLELHGQSPKVAWTQLDANADANATSLDLAQKVDWKKDDEVVVSPTDFYRIGHTELHTLASASGSHLELADALEQP